MSLWNFSSEDEDEDEDEEFSYLAPTDWLLLGANVRSITTHQTKPKKKTKYNLMHADAEAAVILGPWTFVATAGRQTYPKEGEFVFRAISYKSEIIELEVAFPPAPSPSRNKD